MKPHVLFNEQFRVAPQWKQGGNASRWARRKNNTAQSCAARTETLITRSISVWATRPRSRPPESTTHTLWTCAFTAMVITSPRLVSVQVTSNFIAIGGLLTYWKSILGPVLVIFSVNSTMFRYSHDLSWAIGHPLKSVEEKVPTSFFPIPYNTIYSS